MYIFRLIILFYIICLHALMLKKHKFSLSVQCFNTVFPLCLKCFSTCLFEAPLMNTQSPLIGQLTHA